jgi:hypothetical protein
MSLIEFYGGDTQDASLYFGANAQAWAPGRLGVAGTAMWGAPSSNSMFKRLPSAVAHGFLGCSMGASQVDATFRPFLELRGDLGSIAHLSWGIYNGGIQLWRGAAGSVLIGQHVGGFVANAHYYVEVEWVIHDTTGVAKLRLNGTEVISYTGDTRNGGVSTNIDTVLFGANGGINTFFDDWYVCDDAGAAPCNTFLGDVRVLPLRPSAPGANTGFTPDTGANWSRVNETPYSAVNYVGAAASAKDTYTMGDLAAPLPIVHGIKTAAIVKNPDGGNPSARNLVRVGTTDYAGTAVITAATDALVSTLWPSNPATSAAWAASEVNAMEVGVERV